MSFAGHRARKRFGQHWLRDGAVLDRIVAAAAIEPGDHLLEVGPGRGALTERLLASPAASLLAIELDRDLVAGLRQRFGADPRFQLLEGDVLAVPLLPPAGAPPQKVVANILLQRPELALLVPPSVKSTLALSILITPKAKLLSRSPDNPTKVSSNLTVTN